MNQARQSLYSNCL